jgi:hypothetical protein
MTPDEALRLCRFPADRTVSAATIDEMGPRAICGALGNGTVVDMTASWLDAVIDALRM